MDETQFLLLWWCTAENERENDKIAWVYFMILPKKSYSKDQIKAEFKNLENFQVLISNFEALETSAASLASSASATSLASTASTALFPQKISSFWWFDHPWHQNDQNESLFV